MPRKNRLNDWDRLFSPKAPRRGGPLTAVLNITLLAVLFGLLGVAAVLGERVLEVRAERQEAMNATATRAAATTFVQYTATARARAGTATAELGPSGAVGSVTSGGNFRSAPRVAEQTLLGLIFAGDEFVFLAQRDVDGERWYRIRITKQTNESGVPVGTEGWASATLLSDPPGPLPTPGTGDD